MTPDPKFYRWCTKIVTLAWRFRRPHYNCTYTFLILCLKESVVNTLLCKQTWGHLQSSLSWLGTCLVTSRVYLSWVHAYFEYLDPSTSKTCFSFIDQLNSALHSYTVKPQRLSSKWCPSKKATGSACSRTCAPRGKYGENECFLWMQIRSELGILRLYHIIPTLKPAASHTAVIGMEEPLRHHVWNCVLHSAVGGLAFLTRL